MNPRCVLRIIFMIPLCSRINFSNLAGSDQQHLQFYLSADFWHQPVNQPIQDKGSQLFVSQNPRYFWTKLTALQHGSALRFFLHSSLENWLEFCSQSGVSCVAELLEVFCKTYFGENKRHIDDITCIFQSRIQKKNFNISHQQRDKYLLVFRYKNVAEIDTSAK